MCTNRDRSLKAIQEQLNDLRRLAKIKLERDQWRERCKRLEKHLNELYKKYDKELTDFQIKERIHDGYK